MPNLLYGDMVLKHVLWVRGYHALPLSLSSRLSLSVCLSVCLYHSCCVSLRWGVSHTGSSSPFITNALRPPPWVVVVQIVLDNINLSLASVFVGLCCSLVVSFSILLTQTSYSRHCIVHTRLPPCSHGLIRVTQTTSLFRHKATGSTQRADSRKR